MKKLVCLLLVAVMLTSLVACGGSNSSSKSKQPYLDIKQELVNICCDYSNCTTVSNFEIGTQNKAETEDGYKVSAKGSYWPNDEYGDLKDKMLFEIEFTAKWDGGSDYDITVTKKSIKKKKY